MPNEHAASSGRGGALLGIRFDARIQKLSQESARGEAKWLQRFRCIRAAVTPEVLLAASFHVACWR